MSTVDDRKEFCDITALFGIFLEKSNETEVAYMLLSYQVRSSWLKKKVEALNSVTVIILTVLKCSGQPMIEM